MISVVIPAYNESQGIQKTIDEIKSALAKSVFATNYEIIVIDDHSSDGTFDVVANMRDPQVRALRLSQRKGSYTALRAGMAASRGDAVACLSADGQDDPATIVRMIDKWHRGAQVVWALRKNIARTDEPFFYRWSAWLFYRMLKAATRAENQTIDLSRADFYLIDRIVANAIESCHEGHTSLFGLIAWSGFRQDSVEYDRRLRNQGKSKWNFSSRWNLAKDWIIAFSAIPLRAMVWLGFAIGLFGIAYACVITFNHFFLGREILGWSSLMVATVVLGGINIAMLGVMGEYLWRTLDESRKRPLFFIENDTRSNNDRTGRHP
jgi:glycosyltransferase involved in cell wall biosynthesis